MLSCRKAFPFIDGVRSKALDLFQTPSTFINFEEKTITTKGKSQSFLFKESAWSDSHAANEASSRTHFQA